MYEKKRLIMRHIMAIQSKMKGGGNLEHLFKEIL
uniref:Uncharacterized protein n=1 Tax=Rhizophora mucronata TaxID=61149 RepID=A0A2P2M1S7_RHIMU